ncbi:hypothetical protein J4471_02525 [Candidatus Woesearchaeota archaeon]|nr:hypothetical protein [Candidatus Woesearchaeota archaeon]
MQNNYKNLPDSTRKIIDDSISAIVEGRIPNSVIARSYSDKDFFKYNYMEFLFPHRIFNKSITAAVANNFKLFLEKNLFQSYDLEDLTIQRYHFGVKPHLSPMPENSFYVHSEPVYSDPDIWGTVIVMPESTRRDPLIEEYFDLFKEITNLPLGLKLREILDPEPDY